MAAYDRLVTMALDNGAAQKPAKPKGTGKTRTSPPASPAVNVQAVRPPERPAGNKRNREYKKESRWVRRLSSLLTTLMLIVVAAGGLGLYGFAQFEAPGPLETAKGFAVPKGSGRLDIAARLERDGIIANRWTFTAGQIATSIFGAHAKSELKAGSYEFKKGASMREVFDTLAEGRTASVKLTIPEGLTTYQVVERLKAFEGLTGEIEQIPAEGSLLPDTYVFTRGTTRQDLLERMQAEQTKIVQAAWDRRSASVPFQTPQQAIIMASIVEKETGKADERERVAAVFVNRLRKNMRLQSDPTIIYGISNGQGPIGRPITKTDIAQKTAYNTYQIDGLPPTPIANPGRAALEATLNPAQTNDVYFVADGTGGHTFSETLKDHNAAVANWRQVERDAKAAKDAQAGQAAQAGAPAPPQPLVKLNGPGAKPTAAKPADALPVMSSEDPASPAVPAAPEAPAAVPLPIRKPRK